jgi:hypothetical protein
MYFSKEERAMWLEDWQQSGKRPWTYAKENGLVPQTFLKWIKIKPTRKPNFVEIPTQIKLSPQHAPEILIEKGNVKIHIPLGLGSDELCTIIGSLECLS